ncbi:TetR/AcrR family transcriptional regulator [Acidisoma sp. C75]
MSGPPHPSASPRKPRADGLRNRERLLEAAKDAFAELGAEASLDEIARRAGVGIGTLYRNFPNRDAILAEVYRRAVEQLAEAARQLLAEYPPDEALHRWMRLFLEYVATKKVLASALNTLVGGTAELYAASGPLILGAMTELVGRATASGVIRADTEPMDLLHALVGFAYTNIGADWLATSERLVDLLMAGLRRP